MKTPMQELIEQLKELKYSEINEQAWDAYDSVMDIAEALLEKEKDVIMDVHIDGAFNTDWDEHTDVRENAQDYYNETFNTKKLKNKKKMKFIIDDFNYINQLLKELMESTIKSEEITND